MQLQAAVQKIKDDVLAGTKQLTGLQQPFRTNPGEGPEAKDLSTDQIYVNAVIHEGRVNYDFPTDRWEQLKVYPTPNASQSKSVRPEDIFDAQHNNVLVVGRPGIGKTMLSTKLLRMWASGHPKMKTHFNMAFLLKFRHLNSETDLNLYELLDRAETVGRLDDDVWSYIEENPTKVLLIFDGIDEFSARSDVAQDDSYYKDTGETKMPLRCLYSKLVSGKLLRGSTCNDRRKDTESAKHNLFIPVEQQRQNFKMASYKLGHVTRKAGTRLVLHVTILVTSPFLSLIV